MRPFAHAHGVMANWVSFHLARIVPIVPSAYMSLIAFFVPANRESPIRNAIPTGIALTISGPCVNAEFCETSRLTTGVSPK